MEQLPSFMLIRNVKQQEMQDMVLFHGDLVNLDLHDILSIFVKPCVIISTSVLEFGKEYWLFAV